MSEPKKAVRVLQESGHHVLEEKGIIVKIKDAPGALAEVAERLAQAGVDLSLPPMTSAAQAGTLSSRSRRPIRHKRAARHDRVGVDGRARPHYHSCIIHEHEHVNMHMMQGGKCECGGHCGGCEAEANCIRMLSIQNKKSMKRTGIPLAVVLCLALFTVAPFPASALTREEKTMSVTQLFAKVLDLNQKIVALGGTPIVVPPGIAALTQQGNPTSLAPCVIRRTLSFGFRSDDVKCLQTFLIAQNLLTPDFATGYFGPKTRAAVIALQKSHGLEQVGFVGRLTRALINKIGLPIGAKSLVLPPATTPAPLTYGDGGGGGDGGESAPQALISPIPPCTFDRSLIDSCVIQ